MGTSNEMIFSTKGKNKAKKFGLLILGIVAIIAGFAVVPFIDKSSEELGMLVCALPTCFGIFAILTAFVHVSGYVHIYPDHIEGKGKQGKGMNTFYLRPEQVKGATIEQGDLCIHSDLGIYKIICNKNVAKEACAYLNKTIK